MEGYGTDAFVHLRRLGDGEEPLHDSRKRHRRALGGNRFLEMATAATA